MGITGICFHFIFYRNVHYDSFKLMVGFEFFIGVGSIHFANSTRTSAQDLKLYVIKF